MFNSLCNPDETKKISEVGRVPFQEINTNVYMPTLLSPVFPLVSKCKDPKNRVWFTPCNKLASKVNLGEINDFQEAGTPLLSGDTQSACLEAHDNSRIALSPLVEDFDDSFLHEIDTIVGQKRSERIQSTSAREGFSGGSKDPHYDKFKRSIFDEYGADCLFDVPNLYVQDMIPLNPPKIFTRKETERLHGDLSSGYVGDPPHVVEKDKPENTANEISQNYTAGQSAGNFADNDSEAKSRCEHITAFSDPSDRSGDEAQVDQDRKTCDSFANYLHSLNDMQREAVTCDIAVPLMIVAGPGSGKTSTIVLMLLKEEIAASNILAMTFTTAAASETRERIGAYAGKGVAKELMICTFHSFCLQLCRSHHEKLERTADFLIYGTGQQRRAVTEAVRLTEMSRTSGKDFKDQDVGDPSKKDVSAVSCKDKSKKWQKFVAKAKASGKTVEDYQKMGFDLGAKILGHYNDILRSCNALDYYDFISFSLKLLSNFPEVYKYCQDSWKAIVVDEFQDTSTLQYQLLRALASHNHLTVVGDEDQSIFSFNGADISGFDAFRKDFPLHKEVRLQRNYRSTRSIVEASLSLIQHNRGRCSLKKVETDNDPGSKISIVECHTEDAQCSFVIDKILEMTSHNATDNCHFGSICVLYRRQVSGKLFQTSFRSRKIPFNVHGVAFYRKKVTKAIMAILKTSLPGCGDAPYRHAFKALFPGEKSERKMVLDYLLDDVSEFLSSHCNKEEYKDGPLESKGCVHVLQMFIDYVSEREMENFRTRRVDNANSVTLTTIHQSKGLEWDTVFIVKANDGEIPLLNDVTEHKDDSGSIEEERRLLYVAMTRARKKLYILYIVMGTNWQILQPSRFLKELPRHILDIQDGSLLKELRILASKDHINTSVPDIDIKGKIQEDADLSGSGNSPKMDSKLTSLNPDIESEQLRSSFGNSYLRRFKMEDRSYVSHLFHSWAKKQAFHDPRRLLNKVRFVIDERLRCSKNKSKNILEALRSQLKCEEAFEYAEYVISWEKMPVDRRMQVMHEKQEHFQKQRIEASMDSSAATSKQISFLQKLGCTVSPTSRLHASRLIEQYKSL